MIDQAVVGTPGMHKGWRQQSDTLDKGEIKPVLHKKVSLYLT